MQTPLLHLINLTCGNRSARCVVPIGGGFSSTWRSSNGAPRSFGAEVYNLVESPALAADWQLKLQIKTNFKAMTLSISNILHVSSFAAAACVLLVGQAFSQDVTAKRTGEGIITIEGTQMLADACLSLGSLSAGAPDGAAEISNAFAVTLEIRHSGAEMCAQMISEVDFRGEFANHEDQPFIIFYKEYTGYPKSFSELDTRSRGLILTAE